MNRRQLLLRSVGVSAAPFFAFPAISLIGGETLPAEDPFEADLSNPRIIWVKRRGGKMIMEWRQPIAGSRPGFWECNERVFMEWRPLSVGGHPASLIYTERFIVEWIQVNLKRLTWDRDIKEWRMMITALIDRILAGIRSEDPAFTPLLYAIERDAITLLNDCALGKKGASNEDAFLSALLLLKLKRPLPRWGTKSDDLSRGGTAPLLRHYPGVWSDLLTLWPRMNHDSLEEILQKWEQGKCDLVTGTALDPDCVKQAVPELREWIEKLSVQQELPTTNPDGLF